MAKTTKKKGVQDKASISFRQCVSFLSLLKGGWVEEEGGGGGKKRRWKGEEMRKCGRQTEGEGEDSRIDSQQAISRSSNQS